jgi:hypothetical protein
MCWMSGSRLRSLLLAAALVAGAIPAHAQSSDKAMAESLFQAGRALMKQNKPGEACPKFAESNRIDPSPGTLLNLGKCLEATGKTASAWAAYKEAIVLARSTGQSKHVTAGSEFAAAVEPRLSYLKIEISGERRPGMVVKRDGTVIGDGALGVPIAVDPGEHVIEASAPGFATWRTTVTIGAAAEKKDVEVPALDEAPAGAEPLPAPTASTEPAPGPAPSASTTVEPPPIAPGSGSSTLRTLGFVSVGVGLAGIAVGTVFGVLTLGDASDAEGDPSLCPDKRCSQDGLDKIDAAETKALVSTLGLAVGGAATVAGVVMLVVSGKRTTPSTGASAVPRVSGLAGPRGGGLTLTGSF